MLDRDRADAVERYRARYREFGYDPRTLGWKDGTQRVRFDALTRALGLQFDSVLDVGCGFGDFFGYLAERGWSGDYVGVDICPELLEEAQRRFGPKGARFECADFSSEAPPVTADVAVALGLFNHRLYGGNLAFAGQVLQAMWQRTRVAIAADFLSIAADRPRPELFHADPAEILRLALGLSRRVELAHNYMPFEFLVAAWHGESFSPEFPVFDPT